MIWVVSVNLILPIFIYAILFILSSLFYNNDTIINLLYNRSIVNKYLIDNNTLVYLLNNDEIGNLIIEVGYADVV
jgi:hypothetical protein